MKKRYFEYYQYIVPAILTPLSFFLWCCTYSYNFSLVLSAWLLPVLWAYVVPAVGTNYLKVWEIDTKYRLGNFRIHHGFVFGSATSTLAWVCHTQVAVTASHVMQYGFVLASVLGFWNCIYDIKAIQSGILKVYNTPWANEESAESIAMDYAPWFFAGFGIVYGLGLGVMEVLILQHDISAATAAAVFSLIFAISILFPVMGYRRKSFNKYGHSGCRPVQKIQ